MWQQQKRKKYPPVSKTQNITSIFILACLIAISGAILWKQNNFDLKAYGIIKSTTLKNSGTDRLIQQIKMKDFVPKNFQLFAKKKDYDNQSLFEKINGKAPMYLENGFRGLTTQRYIHPKNKKMWLELYIYNMTNVVNAYTVYSQQRRASARPFEPIEQKGYAYLTDNALFAVWDGLYLEIIAAKKDPILTKALTDMGEKIAAAMQRPKKISQLQWINNNHLIPHSQTIYQKNAFGIKEMDHIFTAKYKNPDQKSSTTVFFSQRKNANEAKKLSNKFTQYLIQDGGTKLPQKSDIPRLTLISYLGSVRAVFVWDSFVAGVHEADNEHLAEQLAGKLRASLIKHAQK